MAEKICWSKQVCALKAAAPLPAYLFITREVFLSWIFIHWGWVCYKYTRRSFMERALQEKPPTSRATSHWWWWISWDMDPSPGRGDAWWASVQVPTSFRLGFSQDTPAGALGPSGSLKIFLCSLWWGPSFSSRVSWIGVHHPKIFGPRWRSCRTPRLPHSELPQCKDLFISNSVIVGMAS